MSDDDKFDFNLPDLPSDEELGITEDDYDLLDDEGEIRKDLPPPGAGKPASAGAGSAGAGGKTGKKEKTSKGPRRIMFGRLRSKKDRAAEAGSAVGAGGAAPRASAAAQGASDASRRGAGPSGEAAAGKGKTGRGKGQPTAGSGKAPPGDGGGGDGREGAAVAPPPGARYRGPLVLAALLVVAFASGSDRSMPRPVAANAPDTAFSSARAMTDLVEIARAPHPPGSPEHARVREYLFSRMTELGLDPQVQTATSIIRQGPRARAATVRNLVGRWAGQESTGAILVTAHYDGRGLSRGAGDDGTGVVTLLEVLRAARQGAPLRNDVILLLTDAEELGLLGARAFVDEHPWMADVQVVLSVEMRGGGGPSLMFETGTESGRIVDVFRRVSPHPTGTSLAYEIYRRMPNDTDFTPFKEAGKQGLNFAAIGRAHVYHQAYDEPSRLSERTVQHHGTHVLPVLRELGQADLSNVDAPEPVYFRLPGVGLVLYGSRWVLPFAILLVVLLPAVYLLGRRRGTGGLKGTLVGLLLGAAIVAAGAGAGWYLFREVAPLHPEFGSLHGSAFHSEGWYVLALVAATLTTAVILLSLLRRWFSVGELTLGALLIPLAGAVAASVWTPMGAMVLQWPVLAALLAVVVLAILGRKRENGIAATVAAVLLAAPVLVLMVPLVELVWLAMSLSLAMVLGGLMGVTALLVLPALDHLRRPNGWWAPLLGLGLTAAFLGLGLLNARPSPERPAPSTLLYALDLSTGSALWATDPDTATGDAGVAWATSRVGSFEEESTLEAFLARPGRYRVRDAQPLAVAGPSTRVMSDVLAEGRRTTRVAVSPAVGGELLLFHLPAAPPLVAVNGVPVPPRDADGEPFTEPVTLLEHWGTPEEAVVLDFHVPAAAGGLSFAVVEHLLRPAELLGQDAFVRPPDLAPDITRQSDGALIRSTVQLELGPPEVRTGVAAGDATGAIATDSSAARPDTVPMPADTARTAPPDTTRVQPADTVTAAPDTTRPSPPDTTGPARPDSAAARPDTVRPPPDTVAPPPRDTIQGRGVPDRAPPR